MSLMDWQIQEEWKRDVEAAEKRKQAAEKEEATRRIQEGQTPPFPGVGHYAVHTAKPIAPISQVRLDVDKTFEDAMEVRIVSLQKKEALTPGERIELEMLLKKRWGV